MGILEINLNQMEENSVEINEKKNKIDSQKQIAGAIIIAGLIIAGAILLKGDTTPIAGSGALENITLAKVGASDKTLGNADAKITLIVYEDFQCPFCGKFFRETEQVIRDTYAKTGDVQLVYRDFAFLGRESTRSAEAARCAGDQGKFWEYHDYLYTHQNGENRGGFADLYLKSFAKVISLNTVQFNSCFDGNKYAQAVIDAKAEATLAGVNGTPRGFLVTKKDISKKTQSEIIKSLPPNSEDAISFYTTKNIVSLNGALPWSMVKPIIDILLK